MKGEERFGGKICVEGFFLYQGKSEGEWRKRVSLSEGWVRYVCSFNFSFVDKLRLGSPSRENELWALAFLGFIFFPFYPTPQAQK